IKCYRFVANFNVKSNIETELDQETRKLDSTSNTSRISKIICDKSIIHSLKAKYRTNVDHGSSTHKTNFWSFNQQTLVKIDCVHPEIQNAIIKRENQLREK
ncbi:MAG: hypothetical protein ACK4IX_01255, partial [Candidatus Sericytochromatia bacterium]